MCFTTLQCFCPDNLAKMPSEISFGHSGGFSYIQLLGLAAHIPEWCGKKCDFLETATESFNKASGVKKQWSVRRIWSSIWRTNHESANWNGCVGQKRMLKKAKQSKCQIYLFMQIISKHKNQTAGITNFIIFSTYIHICYTWSHPNPLNINVWTLLH